MTSHSQQEPARKGGEIRPGRGWYLVSLALFILGAIGGIAILFTVIFSSLAGGTQFLVPGSLVVTIKEPGKYILWYEHSTVFKGRRYFDSDEPPRGMGITVREIFSGKFLPVSPSSAAAETAGQIKRKSVGSINFDTRGQYVIEVTGEFPDRVFSLRRSVFSRIVTGVAAFLALSILGWVLAPVIALIVLVKRANAKRRMAEEVEVSTEEPSVQERDAATGMNSQQERTWAMFCHLGTLLGYIIPFANIIVPLIIWQMKKEESSFIRMHGKEALNFQISLMIYSLISALLFFVVGILFLIARTHLPGSSLSQA
jgi:hypothetical protein